MEYMEAKMQEQYDYAEHRMNELSKAQKRFEQAFLAIPDVDETLLKATTEGAGLNYVDQDVEFMWFWFKQGAGV